MKPRGRTYQFKVALKSIKPEIWRRIIVPAVYSFWDLHVAIQDAMGWEDYHLHLFTVQRRSSNEHVQIGIPDPDGFDEMPCLPGWDVFLGKFFKKPGDRADYEYDFGDCWEHEIVLEEIAARVSKTKYPVCIGGARACPPEDCGGVPGYNELLKVLQDPTHDNHDQMVRWVGGHYDPASFNPAEVRFDDPIRRWRMAFQGEQF